MRGVLLGGLFALGILTGPSVTMAQVAPDAISAQLLRKSVRAVLGTEQDVHWRAIPLADSTKQAVRPQLKNTQTLPDTLYAGQVQTEHGPRFLIPDIAPSKSETFSFVLYLDERGTIVDVDVLTYRENYGYEIDYPLFRKQFRGTSTPDDVIFRRTIQNISGATISARSLTYAVRDLLTLVNHLGIAHLAESL